LSSRQWWLIPATQEVEEASFYGFFYPRLQALGYSGTFQCKSMGKLEGIAVFFRAARYGV
jgi:hypothetical protein